MKFCECEKKIKFVFSQDKPEKNSKLFFYHFLTHTLFFPSQVTNTRIKKKEGDSTHTRTHAYTHTYAHIHVRTVFSLTTIFCFFYIKPASVSLTKKEKERKKKDNYFSYRKKKSNVFIIYKNTYTHITK